MYTIFSNNFSPVQPPSCSCGVMMAGNDVLESENESRASVGMKFPPMQVSAGMDPVALISKNCANVEIL